MSWIFGRKSKPPDSADEGGPVARKSQQQKKRSNEDFLLGGHHTEDIDYLQAGLHKVGDERQFANELAELGLDVEYEKEPLQKAGTGHHEVHLVDVDLSAYHVPEMSEEGMALTEEDMNDPELLAELSAIGSDETSKVASPDESSTETVPNLLNNSPTEIPDTEVMDIGELQLLAVSLTNEGRKEEALEIMKRIRYLKYADKLQDTVDTAKQISASHPISTDRSTSVLEESIPPNCSPYGSASDAKLFALKLKKAGHQNEAILWLRYAKQVESGCPILPRVATATVQPLEKPQDYKVSAQTAAPSAATTRVTFLPPTLPNSYGSTQQVVRDLFSPLESALEEAASFHFKRASAAKKELTALTAGEEVNNSAKAKSATYIAQKAKIRTQATDQMRLYKAYTQDLAVLQSRRLIPGAMPPLFRWENTKISRSVENTYLAEDQLELIVNEARDMEVLLSGHRHRSLKISYNIGIPRDNPITGNIPAVNYIDGEGCSWNFKVIVPFKRSRSLHNLLERKKILFEIVLQRGVFYGGDITLGVVSLPLVDLLTKTNAGGDSLPLTKEGRGRSVGGILSAYAKLRTPVDGPEVRITEERRLVLSPWPDTVSAQTTTNPDNIDSNTKDEIEAHEPSSISAPIVAPNPAPNTAGSESEKFSKFLTELELQDPFNPDLLQSNDVMDAELESIKDSLSRCRDPDEQFNLNFRYELIERNLNILVMRVQNESISLDDYLEIVRERLKRDQFMALHFKNAGDTGIALAIMKRIKIMTEELKNAEGTS